MKSRRFFLILVITALLIALSVGLSRAQAPMPESTFSVQAAVGTAFLYEGRLMDSGSPANGLYDFRFKLYDAATGGRVVGSTVNRDDVRVENGLFTVTLDFGPQAFNGEARWLEIAVRPGDSTGAYTTLHPRQPIMPVPYALALPGLWVEQNDTSPNVIGGYSGNSVASNVVGATIGGGGNSGNLNRVTADYGTIGGGMGNVASGDRATVGGGDANEASGYANTIGGGEHNTASDLFSTVGGGKDNVANREYTTVGGGFHNVARGSNATVSGGAGNFAGNAAVTISGGVGNTAIGYGATIGGGEGNSATGNDVTVSGGISNTANSLVSTVGGGEHNTASGWYSTVSGGFNNTASGRYAVAGGGKNSVANGDYATVVGGHENKAEGTGAFVGGGGFDGTHHGGNQALAGASTIAGGLSNVITTTASYATIGGGWRNKANGSRATIAGGEQNTASGYLATIGGGFHNTAGFRATVAGGDSNTASGSWSAIPGGNGNLAQGSYSFAAGRRAKATRSGCFVWGDATNADVTCNANNRTVFRSSGGFYIYTNSSLTSGARLSAGSGSWSSLSDRNAKANITPVDPEEILERLVALPISTWNYKAQDPSIRHMGPMAQDFYAAFGLGEDDTHISNIDAEGVALAAIQALYARNRALEEENALLKARLADLEARVAALEGK